MPSQSLPNHLANGPRLDDESFIFGGYSREKIDEVHEAISKLPTELAIHTAPNTLIYLILGNYDSPQIDRVTDAKQRLSQKSGASAILLRTIDPSGSQWSNFYLKYRYLLSLIDYVVLVAEDNDGGHELEVGEAPLSDVYISKRDYESISIDHDVEWRKYDAMIGKLFEVMDENDRLYEWTDTQSFNDSIDEIFKESTS